MTEYIPRCTNCESAIGPKELTADDINLKYMLDEYPLICGRCHEVVELKIDIIKN